MAISSIIKDYISNFFNYNFPPNLLRRIAFDHSLITGASEARKFPILHPDYNEIGEFQLIYYQEWVLNKGGIEYFCIN